MKQLYIALSLISLFVATFFGGVFASVPFMGWLIRICSDEDFWECYLPIVWGVFQIVAFSVIFFPARKYFNVLSSEAPKSRKQSFLLWENASLLANFLLDFLAVMLDLEWLFWFGISLPAIAWIPPLVKPFGYGDNKFWRGARSISFFLQFFVFLVYLLPLLERMDRP